MMRAQSLRATSFLQKIRKATVGDSHPGWGAGFLALAMSFVEHHGTRGFIPSEQLGFSTNQLLVIAGGWDCCLVNNVITVSIYQ